MDQIKSTIRDVVILELPVLTDERGAVMHMIRKDSPTFKEFGEVYFSKVFPGVVKGWKCHTQMVCNLAVPSGKLKLVMYDDREDSDTKGVIEEVILSEEEYKVVTIPPFIWYSFGSIGDQPAIVANFATAPHNDEEVKSIDLNSNEIPYRWK